MIMVLNGILCGIVWKNLFTGQKFDTNITVYEETAVVLGELDQFYHRQVKLVAHPGIPLGDDVVDVYLFNSSCETLPKVQGILSWPKSNVSNNQTFDHHYLLPRSTFNYTVESVSLGAPDSDIVKGYIYVTRGPELSEFNSYNCQSPDCTIVDYKPFTNGLRTHSYTVESRGYYNLHSVSIVPQYRYSLALTVNATTVDLNQTQPVCSIDDINEGDRSCSIDLQFKPGKVCLVAYNFKNSVYHHTILDAKVTELQMKWVLVTTVAPTVFLVLVVLVCLVGISCYYYKPKCGHTQYKYIPTESP